MIKKLYACMLLMVLVEVSTQTVARNLDDIKKSGEIIICMRKNLNVPPIQFMENGTRVGIDIDLSQRIAKGLGVQARFEGLETVNDRIPCVLNNRGDIVVDSLSVTKERRELIDFSSTPYLVTGVGLLLSKKYEGSTWKDIGVSNNIKHLTVAIEGETSTMNQAFEKYYPDQIERKIYPTDKEAFAAFLNGEVDGFAQDYVKLQPRASKGFLVEGPLTSDSYGVGFNKAYPDLRDEVSKIIKQLELDGSLQKIIDRYIPKPLVETRVTPEKPTSFTNHIVKDKETLSDIARIHCGNWSMWRVIWQANKENIPFPNLINVGATLRIPADCGGAAASATDKTHKSEEVNNKIRQDIKTSKVDVLEQKLNDLLQLKEKRLIPEEVYNKRAEALLKQYGH